MAQVITVAMARRAAEKMVKVDAKEFIENSSAMNYAKLLLSMQTLQDIRSI